MLLVPDRRISIYFIPLARVPVATTCLVMPVAEFQLHPVGMTPPLPIVPTTALVIWPSRTEFVRLSSIRIPLAAWVVGSWSKRGVLIAAVWRTPDESK